MKTHSQAHTLATLATMATQEFKAAKPDDTDPTEAQGRAVLEELAQEFNYPLPSLLEFYRDDLPDFATMPWEQARFIVQDHLEAAT